jgi:uncharacterized protein (TIGR02271 family)
MVDTNNTTWQITAGMDVIDVDGEKVGDVSDVQGDTLVVSKGFFFPSDHSIPTSAITSVSDKVYLNVTKDQALNQDWGTYAEQGTATTDVYDERPITDAGLRIENPVDSEHVGARDTTHDSEPFEHEASVEHSDADGAVRVPLSEEQLTARTREVERGQVEVEKVVSEEEQSIDVPVSEERVTINRRAVDGDVAPGDTDFSEETIEIPVRGEEAVVGKQTRAREEVEISKEPVTRTERVTDTVRREEAQVRDEAGNVIENVDARDTR